jgi:hypothetical protein
MKEIEQQRESMRWFFIEYISQLDINNITMRDQENAIKDYRKQYGWIDLDDDEVNRIWNDAEMCVAYP